MSGPTLPVLLPIPGLPAATTPLSADDLLIVEQGGFAKKIAAASVLPGGTVEANVVYAGPAAGAAAIPEFRALVAADIPGTLDTTVIDGTLAASALLVAGNPVLEFAQQGTVTAYGSLVIGSGLSLTAGGTISASGGSGTVDIGTANHLAYYPASAAEVASAPYVAIGSGSGAGILTLGAASSHSGAVVMADSLSNASGTLVVINSIVGLVGSDGASSVSGTSLALSGGNASGTGNGGDVILTLGTTVGGTRGGQFEVVNLPTVDPAVSNAIWSDGGVLVQSGHTAPPDGFLIALMVNENNSATQFGTFDVGPMPYAGTIENGYGRAGPAGGTISCTSYVGANSGGVLTFGTITGLAALTINNGDTIQTGTATAANVFARGDYIRAIWSQISGSSTGSLFSLTGSKG